MNILVCLESPCPGPAAKAALEMAMSLGGGHKVFALSIGKNDEDMGALDVAKNIRAGHLIWIADTAIPGAGPAGVAQIVAAVAKRIEADAVILGSVGMNEGSTSVPAQVAAQLGWAFVAQAETLATTRSVDPGPDAAKKVALKIGMFTSGKLWTLAQPLPAVITVPGHVHNVGRRRTRTNLSAPELEKLSLADLDSEIPLPTDGAAQLGTFDPLRRKPVSCASARALLDECRGTRPAS